MKKKIFPILWLSNVVLLLLVIILSSDLTIYSILSIYAILLMILMPLSASALHPALLIGRQCEHTASAKLYSPAKRTTSFRIA